MKKVRSAVIAGAVGLSLAFAGCTVGAQPGANGPVDLSMTVWTGDQNVINAYQELATEFRATHPEFGKLTIQTLPFADYVAQVSIQLNGGKAPDLGWIVDSTFPAWVDSGALHDISSLKSQPDWKFNEVRPELYSQLTGPKGELLGYPFANTAHPVIYNKDAFKKAGVETPLELFQKGQWTWKNLRRIAKEMVDSGAVTYGLDIPQFAFTSYALFSPVMKAFGGVSWPGGNTCGLTSPQSLAAFQFLHDMIFVDKSYAAPGSKPNFASGDTAMIVNPPSILSQLADASFTFEMVPQPKGDVAYNPFIGQAAISVFEASAHKDLATQLLEYFTSPKGAERLAAYYVGARSSELVPDRVTQLSRLLTPDAAKRSLIDPLSSAKPQEFPVRFPEVETATKPILDGLWVKDADISGTLAKACAAAEPLLKK